MASAAFIQLIGSIPVDSVEEAFEIVTEHLPGRLRRLPDGEIGERGMFVMWQIKRIWPKEVLAPGMFPGMDNSSATSGAKFTLDSNSLPSTTGYAEHAISSYKSFCRLRDLGKIPKGVKFQVSVPSPTTVVGLSLHADYQAIGENIYGTVLCNDLKTIQDQIPHKDLAIQWDVLAEIAFLEHAQGQPRKGQEWFMDQLRPFFEPVQEGVSDRLARLASYIDDDVDMGFHFCYGDARHQHFIEPVDSAILTQVIQTALSKITHNVAWVHIPVPKSRDDEAYFLPLKSIQDFANTDLILGLVHANDPDGTQRRMATARKVLPGVHFGISTECGLGRTPKEDLLSILEICKEASEQHN